MKNTAYRTKVFVDTNVLLDFVVSVMMPEEFVNNFRA